jgi:hypothetical protein
MPQLIELTDVTLDQTLLNERPPVLTPQLPPNTAYYKVLYYNDVAQKWNFAVRYALLVFKRRLVTGSSALAANINSLLQWGELFVIDGSETAYYARSNSTTTAGTYNGNNTVIKLAGPGAFVSRDSEQIVGAKKVIAADAVIGKNLTVIGEFKPLGATIDCGKYIGAPASISAPSGVTATSTAPYSATVSWSAVGGNNIKNYIVEMSEVGLYTGATSSSSSASSAAAPTDWAAVRATNQGDATSVEVAGLRPGMLYAFRVAALSKTGNIAYSGSSTVIPVLAYAA